MAGKSSELEIQHWEIDENELMTSFKLLDDCNKRSKTNEGKQDIMFRKRKNKYLNLEEWDMNVNANNSSSSSITMSSFINSRASIVEQEVKIKTGLLWSTGVNPFYELLDGK